ncbi:MAG: type II toxin-antitoxin system VapB family antitoxin [Rhodothermales bacterium]|nr:type II toxin-antitoxin system VapB family antitoxin [Rhodothermales bacterium]
MRTTVNLDPEQLATAERLADVSNRSELIRRALEALIERESAKRLAVLGGSEPELEPIRRRRKSNS